MVESPPGIFLVKAVAQVAAEGEKAVKKTVAGNFHGESTSRHPGRQSLQSGNCAGRKPGISMQKQKDIACGQSGSGVPARRRSSVPGDRRPL